MLIDAAAALTVTISAWSLWVRRHTWHNQLEFGGTLTILLQTVATILLFGPAKAIIGPILHSVTGMWNMGDFFAHSLYVFAAGTVVQHALLRMDGIDQAAKYKLTVYYPIALLFAPRLGAFAMSRASRTRILDLFNLDDRWLTLYWCLMCGLVIWLLAYATKLFLLLRTERRYRRTSDMYLGGCIVGIVVCALKIITAVMRIDTAGTWVWLGCCAGTAGFAAVFGYSWRLKTRTPPVTG